MEKRIRTVWTLSLVSAMLAIAVQGYWLYNQYRYVIDTYASDTAGLIQEACKKEYELRRASEKRPVSIMMQRNSLFTDSANAQGRQMMFAFSMKTPVDSPAIVLPGRIDSINAMGEITEDRADRVLRLSFTPSSDISDEELQQGIRRAIMEITFPFRPEMLDSILREDAPGLRYAIESWAAEDSAARYETRWEKTGGLRDPALVVRYAYSPLERKGVCIRTVIPMHPVLGRMAWQVVLAFAAVLLLTGCLVFQIKTILKQKKLGELRENFVNTMVHELKRPVQTLKTFLAFLADREMRSDEEATRQVVQDSMFEIDNLSAYLNKLKDIVRTDSDTTPLRASRFNLRELVAKVVRLMPEVAGKDVRISAACDAEAAWAEADPVHVANMLSNLIENSVKYSAQEVTVEVKTAWRGKEIVLSVTDNGIGIPLSEQARVFDKFYRASNLPDRNIPGLGLGLSYVKLMTEAHGGRVVLHSRPGEGTTVELIFPQ